MRPALGVCYYPEQWPRERWSEDARRMKEAGLSHVRIGEFAWSMLEPEPGQMHFEWLDEAIAVLGAQGLGVVLGTPTATPPRWMLDKHPLMLARDAKGRPRGFGSRRHYCFSHEGYLDEARRITQLLAKRYGTHPHIVAWQTDNEYGCHDTVLSYSAAALAGFVGWLEDKYESIGALNAAWGNVFWSMDYQTFGQIGLPNETVTTPNPAHLMDFWRYSSDRVARFNRTQTEIIRAHSRAPILHNYMGGVTDFDHFATGADLDIAGWDSYPIGFLSDRVEGEATHKSRFLRQGDPDYQAFHHDLYRAVGRGRWWVVEQQPGPVNWAPWNPAPLRGMVRLWALEAFAHGAELVSFFRWRQASFAQEQMHAGLLRPDGADAPAMAELRALGETLKDIGPVDPAPAEVALVFDYASDWAWRIEPQGADFSYFSLVFEFYKGLRRFGLNIDFVSPNVEDLSGYKFVLAPGLFNLGPTLADALEGVDGPVLLGPRFNAKTQDFAIPTPLPPALKALDLRVVEVESLPPGEAVELAEGGRFERWFEHLEGTADILARTRSGEAALAAAGKYHYLAGWPDEPALAGLLAKLLQKGGIPATPLPEPLRQRTSSTHRFIFNYGAKSVDFEGRNIPAADMVFLDRVAPKKS